MVLVSVGSYTFFGHKGGYGRRERRVDAMLLGVVVAETILEPSIGAAIREEVWRNVEVDVDDSLQ